MDREEYLKELRKNTVFKPKIKKKKKNKSASRKPVPVFNNNFFFRQRDKSRRNFNKYNNYLKSEEWSELKEIILKKYNHKCYKCGDKAYTAHHKVYRKWGREDINDLVAVCWNCHKKIHDK